MQDLMKHIVTILVFLLLSAQSAMSQCYVESIKIAPLNRALICLHGKSPQFTSRLSDDKQSVIISIANAKPAANLFPIESSGIISSVTQVAGSGVQLQVNLTDKRGYSAFLLPMSNAICVEVFDWSKLSEKEDSYRSALLALESGVYASAKDYLEQSAGRDVPNAAAILGVLEMMLGNEYKSLENLHIAADNSTNVPDAYSALSQYYTKKGDQQKAKHYHDLYTQNSGGLTAFLPIQVGGLHPEKIKPNDPLSFLSYGVVPDADTSTNDSAEKNQSSTKSKTKQPKSDNSKENGAWWASISPTYYYVVIGVGLFALMMFSSYRKWRKAQLAALTASQNNNFESTLRQAQNINAVPEEPRKTKQGRTSTAPTEAQGARGGVNIYKQQTSAPKADAANRPREIATRQTPNEKNADKVERLAQLLIKNKQNGQENISPAKTSTSPKIESDNTEIKNPGINLAMSLANKQKNIRNKNLQNLNPDDTTTKKAGISDSAIEAKRKIMNLETDEEERKRIADKFNKGE